MKDSGLRWLEVYVRRIRRIATNIGTSIRLSHEVSVLIVKCREAIVERC